MKVAIISDTHLSASKYTKIDHKTGMNRFLIRQFETMEWIVSYLREHNITTVLHAGDMFDSSRAGVYPLTRARELLDGLDVYAIKGNHDDNSLLHREEISALDLIGVKSYNTVETVDIDGVDVTLVPWGYEAPHINNDTKRQVLVAHAFPKDYLGGGERPDHEFTGVISKRALEYDLVITGHYHAVDEFSEGKTRFLNPGAISAFGNSTTAPSIWVLDTEDLSYERVRIPCAIQLITASPTDLTQYLDSIEDENIYRLYISSREQIDRKSLASARRRALEIQLRLVESSDASEATKETHSDFWTYVSENSSYEGEFRKALSESVEES